VIGFSFSLKKKMSNNIEFQPGVIDHAIEPFRWDEVRRAQLCAELDAYYACLYGLTRDELRYILDPKEVHGHRADTTLVAVSTLLPHPLPHPLHPLRPQ
jgi:hypothetical protein